MSKVLKGTIFLNRTPKVRFFLSNFWGAVQFNFFLFGDHFPEKINDIGQSVGIDDESDGLTEKDNQHVLFESHLGQGRQHAEKVGWTDGPNHHEDKEALKAITLIQPADVFIIGALADDRLYKGRTVGARQIKYQGAANDNTDIVINGADDMAVDENASDRGQGARDNGHYRL